MAAPTTAPSGTGARNGTGTGRQPAGRRVRRTLAERLSPFGFIAPFFVLFAAFGRLPSPRGRRDRLGVPLLLDVRRRVDLQRRDQPDAAEPGPGPQFLSVILAGTLLGTLPVLVVFVVLGRQIVSGILHGGVKG